MGPTRSRSDYKVRFPSELGEVEKDLLPVAVVEFVKGGPNPISFAELAARAGLSRQRVTYHFENLDQILIRLTSLWMESGQKVTMEHLALEIYPTAQDKIRGMALALFEWMEKYPHLSRLTPVISQASIRVPAIHEIFSKTMQVGRARIQTFLRDIPSLRKASSAEVEQLATACHLIMASSGHYALTLGGWKKMDDVRVSTLVTLESLLIQVTERGPAILKEFPRESRRRS